MPPQNQVLDEQIDPDYEPTMQEVEEYAQWLGMDLDRDRDLFWIARQGLKAPLPAPWKPCQSGDNDEIFYFNFETGESVWDHPCDEHYRKVYAQEKARKEGRAPPTDIGPSGGGGAGGGRKGKDKKEKKEKKKDKDKPGDDLGSGDMDLHLSGIAGFGTPAMNLPKPGESLFGKPGKSKLVFDSKPKAKAEPSAPAPRVAPTSSHSSDGGKQAERERMESEHRSELEKLRSDFEDKRRSEIRNLEQELAKEMQDRRAALEGALRSDLEKTSRERIQRDVEDSLRTFEADLERQRRERIDRDVEERLRPVAAALERERRDKIDKDVDEKLQSYMVEVERQRKEKIERDVDDKLRYASTDMEREKRVKLEREVEERLASLMVDFEKQHRERLERQVEDKLRSWEADLERERRERLERNVEEKMKHFENDLEKQRREKIEREVGEKLLPWTADLEKQKREQAEREVHDQMNAFRADAEKKLRDLRESQEREFQDESDRLTADHLAQVGERKAELERQTAEELEHALAALRSEHERRLEEEKQNLAQLAQKTEARVPEPSETRETGGEEAAALRTQVNDLQNSKSTLEARIRDLEAQAEQMELHAAKLTAAESEATALRSQVGELQTSKSGLEAQVRDLEAQVKQAELSSVNLTAGESEASALRNQVSELQQSKAASESRIRDLEAQVEQAELCAAEAKSGDAEAKALRVQVSELQNSKSTLEARIRDLEAQAEQTDLHVAKLNSQISASGAEAGKDDAEAALRMQEQVATLREELMESRAAADRAAKSFHSADLASQLQLSKANLEARVSELTAGIEKANQDADESNEQTAALREELKQAQTAMRDAAGNAGISDTDLRSIRFQLAEAQEQAAEGALATREVASLRFQLKQLQAQVATGASQTQETERHHGQRDTEADAAADQMQGRMLALESEYTVATSEMDSLRTEVQSLRSLNGLVETEMEQRLRACEQKRLEQVGLVDSMRHRNHELDMYNQELKADATKNELRACEFERSCKDLEAHLAQARTHKRDDDERIDLAQVMTNCGRSRLEKDSSQGELGELRAEVNELRRQLSSKTASASDAYRPWGESSLSQDPRPCEECYNLREHCRLEEREVAQVRQQLTIQTVKSEQSEADCERWRQKLSLRDADARPQHLRVDGDEQDTFELDRFRAESQRLRRKCDAGEDQIDHLNRKVDGLRSELSASELLARQLRCDLDAKALDASSARAEVAAQQQDLRSLRVELSGHGGLQKELWELRGELQAQRCVERGREEEVQALRAELRRGRSSGEEAATLRAELAQCRLLAGGTAGLLSGPMGAQLCSPSSGVGAATFEWGKPSGALDEVFALRGRLHEQSLQSSTETQALRAVRHELLECRWEGEQAVCELRAKLLHEGRMSREEQSALRAQIAEHEHSMATVKTSERAELHRAHETVRNMQEQHALLEERCKRLSAGHAAEQQDSEKRLKRARDDVNKLQSELDDATSRARAERRQHCDAVAEAEEELLALQRQLITRDAQLKELKELGEARHSWAESQIDIQRSEMEESEACLRERLRTVLEREKLVRDSERVLRRREGELEDGLSVPRRELNPKRRSESQSCSWQDVQPQTARAQRAPPASAASQRSARPHSARSTTRARGSRESASPAPAQNLPWAMWQPPSVHQPGTPQATHSPGVDGLPTQLNMALALSPSHHLDATLQGEPAQVAQESQNPPSGGSTGLLDLVQTERQRLQCEHASLQKRLCELQSGVDAGGLEPADALDARMALDVRMRQLTTALHETSAVEHVLQGFRSRPVSAACADQVGATVSAEGPGAVQTPRQGFGGDPAMPVGAGLLATPRTPCTILTSHAAWLRDYRTRSSRTPESQDWALRGRVRHAW